MEKELTISINDTVLYPEKAVDNTAFVNGDLGSVTFVVNDALMTGMERVESYLNIQSIDEDAASRFEQILEKMLSRW